MSLTLPIDELNRFQICVKLGSTDGRLSLCLKPAAAQSPLPSMANGLTINFEETDYGLCVFASFDPTAGQAALSGGDENANASTSNANPWVGEQAHHDLAMNNLFQAASDSHSGDDGMLGYCFAPWATDITEWEKDTAGHQDSVSRNLFSVPDSASFDVDSSPFCLLPQPSQGASEDGRSSHQHASHVTPAGAPAAISRTENIPPTPKSEASNSPSNDCTMSTASSSTSSGTGTGKQRRRRFSCILQGCDRQFTSEYTRKVHMTTHQPKVKTSLPCTMPGCQEMFSRQHDRLRHEVSQHGKSCEWSCSVCRRFFSSERMLQIHKCQGQASNSRWTVPDQKPSNA